MLQFYKEGLNCNCVIPIRTNYIDWYRWQHFSPFFHHSTIFLLCFRILSFRIWGRLLQHTYVLPHLTFCIPPHTRVTRLVIPVISLKIGSIHWNNFLIPICQDFAIVDMIAFVADQSKQFIFPFLVSDSKVFFLDLL